MVKSDDQEAPAEPAQEVVNVLRGEVGSTEQKDADIDKTTEDAAGDTAAIDRIEVNEEEMGSYADCSNREDSKELRHKLAHDKDLDRTESAAGDTAAADRLANGDTHNPAKAAAGDTHTETQSRKDLQHQQDQIEQEQMEDDVDMLRTYALYTRPGETMCDSCDCRGPKGA